MNSSSLGALKNSAGFVRANSVQSQFSALTSDRDRFRSQKEAAEKETLRARERLQLLREEQLSLVTKIQSSQESLGTQSRKHALLKQEQVRLERVMKSERSALQDCANHTAKLVQQEQEMTNKYYMELGKLNEEAASFLETRILDSLLPHISVDSLEKVLQGNNFAESKQLFEEKVFQIKRLEQLLRQENDRCNKIKPSFDKIQPILLEQGKTVDSSPHLDIFYGPEGMNASGN